MATAIQTGERVAFIAGPLTGLQGTVTATGERYTLTTDKGIHLCGVLPEIVAVTA